MHSSPHLPCTSKGGYVFYACVVVSNRKKAEIMRGQRELRKMQGAARERGGGRGGGRGRGVGGRGGGEGGRGGGGGEGGRGGRGGGQQPDVESLRRQEAEEISKLQSKNNPVSIIIHVWLWREGV